MSSFVINDDGTKGQIKDVMFCYVKLQGGAYKYQSKTEKEYTLDCVVDKATAKAYKKAFPKNGYKEIDTPEFEDRFKVAPLFPDEDEQYVIKLRADAQLNTDVEKFNLRAGDQVPYEWASRPKVFIPADGGVQDVTMEKLVGNGSKGLVGFKINENDYGQFPQLTGILVTELIEYEQSSGSMSDFGVVVGGFNPGDGNHQQVPTEGEQDQEPDNPPEDPEVEDMDDDIPF